jgi:hypothetical protein
MKTDHPTTEGAPGVVPSGPAENRRTLAGLARKQSRAHRALAILIEKEVRLHAYLKVLAEQSADHQAGQRSGRLLKWLGDKHVEQEEMGRKEIWAHTQMAASTEARALACERLLELDSVPDTDPEHPAAETREAVEARQLLVRHARLAKEEETGRRRDVALTRMALAGVQRRLKRGAEPKALAGITGENETARLRRMTSSTRTHVVMSRLLAKQARAHELLAGLLDREATALAFIAGPAGSRHEPDPGAANPWARSATGGGDHPVDPAAKSAWAHHQLAARSAARADWHESCAQFVTTSLEAAGARPRAGGRRPALTPGRR